MMVVLSIFYFGILLTAQVALGIPWNTKPAARYAGYDLERGPVLYEAYYPEEQESVRQLPTIYQEKRYFDRTTVPERSYQIPLDPYEVNSFHPESSAESNEDYLRLNSPRFSAPAFTNARAQTAVQDEGRFDVDEEHLNEEYVFGEQPMQMNREQPIRRNADYSLTRSQPNNIYDNGYQSDRRFVEENRMDFNDAEEVQRIVPINDEFIFGEKPVNNLANFPEPLRNFNDKENFESENFQPNNYNQLNNIHPSEMENIFEPRPQVINYVFSKPRTIKPMNLQKQDSVPEIEDNNWPRNYGDNLLQGEIKKADEQELRKEEAKVTSIKVSEVPRHKIRHHHGELPKRNYGHN